MTDQELLEFRGRCVTAKMYNRKMANAESYVQTLESEAGPVPLVPGVTKASPAHLILLVDKVLRVRYGEEKPEKKAKPAKAPVKAVAAKKAAPKKEPVKKAVAKK